jgi:hypothetical protein
MRISPSALNRKINSFIDQLRSVDLYVILHPCEMDPDEARTIAMAKGWNGAAKDVLMPCYSLNEVVVRRLA